MFIFCSKWLWNFHDKSSEVGSDTCCLYMAPYIVPCDFWNWLVFQNCQTGEQSYIHVGCSALCLSMSCNYEYDKSIVSCIQLDRCFQFKYHSRKVCSIHWVVFIITVMFPMMKFLGVFSIFQFIHSFYVSSTMWCCSSCVSLIRSKMNHRAYIL